MKGFGPHAMAGGSGCVFVRGAAATECRARAIFRDLGLRLANEYPARRLGLDEPGPVRKLDVAW